MSAALIVAVFGLLLLPSVVRRMRLSLAPAEWATINAGSLVGGVVLFELALVVCAAPLVLFFIHGGDQKHFFPGGMAAGYVSLAAAFVIPVSIVTGIVGVNLNRRVLRAEPWFGEHHTVDGVDIAIVPTVTELAFSLPGEPPQIVISRGLVDALTEDELRTVLQHEAAHIRHHHSMYLLIVAALSPLFGRFRPIRRSLDSLELSIECWADSVATPTDGDRRSTSSALLALAHVDLGPGIAAFSKAETTAIRLQALADKQTTPQSKIRGVLYGVLAFLVFIPLAILWMFVN